MQLSLLSPIILSSLTSSERARWEHALDYCVGRGWFPVQLIGLELCKKLVRAGFVVTGLAGDHGSYGWNGGFRVYPTTLGLQEA